LSAIVMPIVFIFNIKPLNFFKLLMEFTIQITNGIYNPNY
jgi:hypothetical protein